MRSIVKIFKKEEPVISTEENGFLTSIKKIEF